MKKHDHKEELQGIPELAGFVSANDQSFHPFERAVDYFFQLRQRKSRSLL